MTSCPGCHYKATPGFTTSHFFVYTCAKCKHRYCFECPSSDGGKRCPECGSTTYSNKEKVYLK